VIEYCICKHSLERHDGTSNDGTNTVCMAHIEMHSNGIFYGYCPCNKFQLDNLQYIEDLAKIKGLI
jgi:hypothetical protein